MIGELLAAFNRLLAFIVCLFRRLLFCVAENRGWTLAFLHLVRGSMTYRRSIDDSEPIWRFVSRPARQRDAS